MELAQGEKEKKYFHELKAKLKKKLPAWVFSAGEITKSEKMICGKPCMAAWRKSEFVRLNGLCMLDIDNIKPLSDSPEGESQPARACFERIVEKWNREASPRGGLEGVASFCKHYGILFAHITPSGRGLRLVFKADPERGYLADNQQWLAKELSVKLDEACKDATRLSYGCTRADILYIELENLLNYDNEAFEKEYGEAYRKGGAPLTPPLGGSSNLTESLPQGGGLEGAEGASYHGVPYATIADAWLRAEYGHLPAVGERNACYYALVQKCMRFICDFSEDMVVRVTPDYGLPEPERRAAARSAIGARRYGAMPRQLTAFLETLGITAPRRVQPEGLRKGDAGDDFGADWDFERWADVFDPYTSSPQWRPVCSVLERPNRINGLLAAASMFGTLLSGCRLRNWYNGKDYIPLTYMTYIIGDAGTGKGEYYDINRLIMEPLRQEDQRGRKAEEAYQAEMKRLSMAKAKKDEIPEEKHFPVRYLPTDTTLKQKLERCMDALAMFGSEQRQVACYNFETELTTKINVEKSTWNSSQDFDKKSFDCEEAGSESRSAITRNGLVPAYFNFVVTGTPDAMQRKVNARNCLDGLPTRLIMGIQYGMRYEMIRRCANRRTDADSDWMRTVGNRLLRCGWDVNLEQRVSVPRRWQDRLGKKTSFADALFYWGQQKGFALSLDDDRLGDYFRKRPPLIAVRLAVVDAILGSLDSFEQTGQLDLKFSSIELALHLADYIYEAQMWYFGRLVGDALAGAKGQEHVKRVTKNMEAYNELPDEFTVQDVVDKLVITSNNASTILCRWMKQGFTERTGRGKYKKLIKLLDR